MVTARISRMLRELQSEPATQWFFEALALLEPRELPAESDVQFESKELLGLSR